MRHVQIDMQEQQIRQLEKHVAQLTDSLKAGGVISQSVTSKDTAAPEVTGEGGGLGQKESRGADGDLP